MRVLCLIDSLDSGGAQRQLIGLAILLKKRSHDVEVLTYYDFPFYAENLNIHGVKSKCTKSGGNYLKSLYLLYKEIKAFSPDVLISFLDTPSILACLFKISGLKFRLIVSERNTTQKLNFKEKIKFLLYRYAQCIVANSYTQGKFIETHFPQYKNKLHVITNFVDLKIFKPACLKTENSSPVILIVGRIAEQKNVLNFLEAIKQVVDKGYQLSVNWYGRPENGDYYAKCLELIRKLGLKNVFIFHSPSSFIVKEYQEADIFCLPSIYEGFPNVLCEAMACGLPVVCSRVCDNTFIVEEGENGLLFNPLDVKEIAGRLSELLDMSQNKKRIMGESNRQKAMELFDEQVFVQKYECLFDK